MISLLTLKAYNRSYNSTPDNPLESMTCQLNCSFDAIEHLTQSNLDSCQENDHIDDEEDDDYDDAAPDDTDEESDDDISFYLNLLMNLSPSMEQVYSQAMKDKEHTTSMVSGGTRMAHVAQPPRLLMVTDEKKNQDQSPIMGSAALTDKAFCKSLRERFTKMMQKRSKEQDKKLWPKIPIPPRGASLVRFRQTLHYLSGTPLEFENSASLDEALSVVPLDDIYREAEEENLLKQAQAMSLGPGERPQLGYQDCVIRALSRYALA